MTVDRSWIESFKATTPGAFSSVAPIGEVATVFIDCQLKLQCPQSIHTWDLWFEALYLRPIQRYLSMPGVKNLVIAFDDYTFSPLAKKPTQARRISRCEVPSFTKLCQLPPTIPDNYPSLLFNRNFKKRVVTFVISQIKLQCRVMRANQRVVVDYENCPYVLLGDGAECLATDTNPAEPTTEFEVSCGLGESDVKWTRFTAWGPMLLDAVDSDYVIIGCATFERLGLAAPNIFVRRLLLLPSNAAVAAVAEAAGEVPTKRPKGSTAKGTKRSISEVSTTASGEASKKSLGRQYEFVNCGMVVEGLRATVGAITPDDWKPYVVRLLTHSIALCGCDFCPGVPWFNGTAAQRNMRLLWPGLCKAASVDPGTGAVVLDPRTVAEEYIGKFWKQVQFKKQCAGIPSAGFEQLYRTLKADESISAFRRDRLVSPEQMSCMVRNSNWISSYWTVPEQTPCALEGDYGFIKKGAGKVEFDKSTPLPVVPPPTTQGRVPPHVTTDSGIPSGSFGQLTQKFSPDGD
jgi:hypothetical protein